ncbi:hypothetical protein [Kordia jejudonensis]|uniref:hypothetical protein n=1 Tax=Kordia jejudonensis TaxID=1348245 RepID=UPI000629902A|nr:hypothetical protein [Kordia jejudonensis]
MENDTTQNFSRENFTHFSIAGGWTPYDTDINNKAIDVFNEAMRGLVGIKYTPIACATQIVNGVNYSFFCNAQVVGLDYNEAVTVSVFENLSGEVRRIGITRTKR